MAVLRVELMVKIRLNNVFLFLFFMKDFLMQNLNKINRVFILKKNVRDLQGNAW